MTAVPARLIQHCPRTINSVQVMRFLWTAPLSRSVRLTANSYAGVVYIYDDSGVAQSVSVSATDNERNGSTWEYMTTTGSSCGAAQFATTQTSYTEGSRITFTAESDAGKRVCFKTTDTAGNATVYTLSNPVKTIDRTAPVLSATRIGTGSTHEPTVSARLMLLLSPAGRRTMS